MKTLLSLALASLLIAPLGVDAKSNKHYEPTPQTQQAQPSEADLKEHGHYVNKAGQQVHSPAHTVNGKVPAGASAKCGDGSYSFSRSRRGTCSHHGGVAEWL